ncbi:hypothetical protein AgCh_000809 [Apium graveolens]
MAACLMLLLLETIRSSKTESNGIGFVVLGCGLRARRRTAAMAVFFVSGDARRGRRTKGGLGTKEASSVLLCIRYGEETNSNHDVWSCFSSRRKSSSSPDSGTVTVVLCDLGSTRTRVVKKRVKPWDPLIPKVGIKEDFDYLELPAIPVSEVHEHEEENP